MATKFPPPNPPKIVARNHGGTQTPKAIVLHGTVSSDNAGTARNIAAWWAGPTSPTTSAHYIVDPKETIQCVGDHTVAYHCGYNTGSIAIEMCDEQSGPGTRWNDADSRAIILRTAALTAQLCLAYDISPTRPSVADLKAKGPHGIYGHNDSRLAFGFTTHSDPLDFPWAAFLNLVDIEIKRLKGVHNPPKAKTFKILHAPLHGASATNTDLRKALARPGVVGIGFSEAYKHGKFLGGRPSWRATLGDTKTDARGRMVERDVTLLVKRSRKHINSGIRLGARASTPEKIAPERYMAWTLDEVNGKPLAMIGAHPHAAVVDAWDSDRAEQYRKQMRRLEALIRWLRLKYGADLDIVVIGDLNFPEVKDDDARYWIPQKVFKRTGLSWINRHIDWVAYSQGLKVVDKTIVPTTENGQDHPWIEVEFKRR